MARTPDDSRLELLQGTLELNGPGARQQEHQQRVEQCGLASEPRERADDERDAAFDEQPERRGKLRIERAGTDQLDDRTRCRRDVADAPPAPHRRGLGHRRSVRPGLWSVKRAGFGRAPPVCDWQSAPRGPRLMQVPAGGLDR